MISLTHDVDVPQPVQKAVAQANALLRDKELYDIIKARPKPFDLSDPDDLEPSVVSEALRNLTQTFNVVMYHYPNKPNTTGSYFCSPKTNRRLRLSDREEHVNRGVDLIVNTLIHECVHALDCFASTIGIAHGDNDREGKEETAPYWIGDQAGRLIQSRNGLGLATGAPYTNVIEVYYGDDE